MMGKKEDDSDMKGVAKLKVLKHLKDMASQMMGDDLKGGMDGMKKVTVAAPDEAGLKEGLDKAKEVVGQMHGMTSEDPQAGMEHPDMDNDEDEENSMSPEEIDEEIQHLMELKKHMMMGKQV